MVAWILSLVTGAVAAFLTLLIAVGALTGVDADADPAPNGPGQGTYGDD